jgi:hypothetical protein
MQSNGNSSRLRLQVHREETAWQDQRSEFLVGKNIDETLSRGMKRRSGDFRILSLVYQ